MILLDLIVKSSIPQGDPDSVIPISDRPLISLFSMRQCLMEWILIPCIAGDCGGDDEVIEFFLIIRFST
jgi:hypothetical protein